MSTIVTLLSNPNNPILSNELISAIKSDLGVSNEKWLAPQTAWEVEIDQSADDQLIESVLVKNIGTLPIDYAIQSSENRRKKALIADMDSTMIDQECIDELAAEVGLKDQVSKITAMAMNGEIEFHSALKERVALLKGLPEDIYKKVIDKRITLASGGKTLVATMKANGTYCALVSGGFTLFTNPIAHELGFDENKANILLTENGSLSGKVAEPILGAEAKVEALQEIAAAKNLSASDFIAVGDGANDLPMLQTAGTGVALHAKPTVAAQARIKINHGDLTSLLYLQGYSIEEFVTDDPA